MNEILGVPVEYDLKAPEDRIKIHPKAFIKILEFSCQLGNVEIFKHRDGSVSVGGTE